MPLSGYSGMSLAKKLGIKEGFRIKLVNPPDYYFDLFTDLPVNLNLTDDNTKRKDFIHFFTKQENEFTTMLPALNCSCCQTV